MALRESERERIATRYTMEREGLAAASARVVFFAAAREMECWTDLSLYFVSEDLIFVENFALILLL